MEQPGKRADHVLQTVAEFAKPDYGVDVFKLENPVPAKDVPDPGDRETAALYAEMGRLAGRPWVMLSAGATKEAFRRVLHYAYDAGASGFLAGRAIWWDSFQHFPNLQAMTADLTKRGRRILRGAERHDRRRRRGPGRDWLAEVRPEGAESE